ncbi:MAG: mannonate dehydratase [Flavobacteriaceae bacterium]|nr:mannonate dehydratase [Flavobacteriaceae bacterium]
MKQSFRWYGKNDPVSLKDILQAGASNVVSALHHIKNGDVWEVSEIEKHKKTIQNSGLNWEVVESVPVHEDIFLRKGNYKFYIENYKKTIQNLSDCGINIICYNFMPILDWTRTNLEKKLANESLALSFEIEAFIAFDLYILKRHNAKLNYNSEEIKSAEFFFKTLNKIQIDKLTNSIIAGLPGSEIGYSMPELKSKIHEYNEVSKITLRNNLFEFLNSIIPTAEKCGTFMCIHPDDPPFNLFGIPRIVSTKSDLKNIFNTISSIHNGLTFCSGSLGVRADNNLIEIFDEFANRINFLHFRSTKRTGEKKFYEANHLEGDIDMYLLVKAALIEEKNRKKNGKPNIEIPMRPDHGHQMLDDLHKKTNPGYSAIGRLKGLAEIRGLEIAIQRIL